MFFTNQAMCFYIFIFQVAKYCGCLPQKLQRIHRLAFFPGKRAGVVGRCGT
jgi:hypothetical protein